MSLGASWNTLLDELDDLRTGATLVTPLTREPFRVTDTQDHRVIVQFEESGDTRPLQRDQFDTLYERIREADGVFELDRLPPDAEPYASVLSLHPRFEVDEREGVIVETDAPTTTQVLDAQTSDEDPERAEPNVDVYADALLLVDALERHDPTDLTVLETPALVTLYTLLSDVQRNANDLRQSVTDVLLDRLHHDRPVSGPFGTVQRTTRRNRSLKDDDEVLAAIEDAGVDPERVTGVDRQKVDDALDVTDLTERDVYDIESSEYVRKADVDEDTKESRLQGLKDQLAATDEDTEQLQQEIEDLEARIEDLTSFESGRSFHTQASGDP